MRFFIFLKKPFFCALLDYSGELLNFSRYAFGGACACDLQYRTLAMHPSVLCCMLLACHIHGMQGLAKGHWRVAYGASGSWNILLPCRGGCKSVKRKRRKEAEGRESKARSC